MGFLEDDELVWLLLALELMTLCFIFVCSYLLLFLKKKNRRGFAGWYIRQDKERGEYGKSCFVEVLEQEGVCMSMSGSCTCVKV